MLYDQLHYIFYVKKIKLSNISRNVCRHLLIMTFQNGADILYKDLQQNSTDIFIM